MDQTPVDEEFEDGLGETLLSRIEAIRSRMIWTLLSIVVVCAVSLAFAPQIFAILVGPLQKAFSAMGPETMGIGKGPGVGFGVGVGLGCGHVPTPGAAVFPQTLHEMFIVYLKLGLLMGVFFSSPLIFFQLWQIVAPKIMREIRWLAYGFAAVAAFFFVGGALFGYYIVFPLALQFLMSLGGDMVQHLPSAAAYFSMASLLLFAFGASFELPVVITMLAKFGVVNAAQLASWRRYMIVALLVVGAMLTPPDPATQVLLAVPLMVLYEIGIIAARIVGPKPSAEA